MYSTLVYYMYVKCTIYKNGIFLGFVVDLPVFVLLQQSHGLTSEQRSTLQSPILQPTHDRITPEQRSDINSPMVYQKNEAEWPTNKPESYYKAKDKQMDRWVLRVSKSPLFFYLI